MLKFPIKRQGIQKIMWEYLNTLSDIKKIDFNTIEKLSKLISRHYLSNKNILFVEMGSLISDHFICDHLKGTSSNTNLLPKIFSLSSSLKSLLYCK